jgi:hypothetical protein
MRVKNILSVVAFIAAFGFSAVLATVLDPRPAASFIQPSFDRTTAQNITSFLEQDIQNGQDRNHQVYRADEDYSLSSPYIVKRAQAVSEYAEESGSMDFSYLPQDFQLAWMKHMRAWHNYSDFLQKVKTQRMSSSEINQLENQYNREINLTWFEVLRVGNRYGADVSNAY